MIIPKAIADTFPENWPEPLKNLSAPTVSIPLSEEDTWTLGNHSTWFRRMTTSPPPAPLSEALLSAIDKAADAHPEGFSPRIGLCSWKDARPSDLPSYGRRGVLHTITGDSERVGRGLAAHVATGIPAFLHLRAWQDIPRFAEFRVFVRESRVIGISQYHWRESFPEIHDQQDALMHALRQFLPKVLAHLPTPNCAPDICISGDKPFVIEVNPLLSATDGCLFAWDRDGDFDGSLRVRHGRNTVSLRPS